MHPKSLAPLCAVLILGMSLTLSAGLQAAESGAAWTVEKSSGDVWISTGEAQPVSLHDQSTVKPGETVRTGQNGMLLLRRGEETMLLSANAVIEIPASNRDGMSTTIFERAGSVLLEVEKQKVNHFEVVTPYLAAVVKGTRFRVSADGAGSSVEVLRGQVQVSDFPSGDKVLLLPGQTAQAHETSKGLKLSGSGLFNPIEAGAPGASPVKQPAGERFASATPSVQPASAPQAQAPLRQRSSDSPDEQQYGLSSVFQKFDASTVGVPVVVGLLVSVAISVQRGSRKRKKQRRA